MNLRISRTGAITLVAALLVAGALFFYLLARFGGPSLSVSEPYRVSATIPDTKGLSPGSEILDRGVHIGQVRSIDVDEKSDAADVSLEIDDSAAPIRKGATIRVGQKTLFGEAYVDLDPGPARDDEIDRGSRIADSQVKPEAIDVDEALKVLNQPSRARLKSLLTTVARGDASPRAGEQMNATLGELARTTSELRGLTDTLAGQRDDIAVGVQSARQVVQTLADRDAALRAIVGNARTTLGALSSRADSLRAGAERLPGLLATAHRTLVDAKPLLTEARPLTGDLDSAAPPLSAALDDLPPVIRDANSVLDGLPQLERVGVPFLGETREVLRLARPAVPPLEAALRNVQPVAGFLSERKQAFAAWFSNTGDLGSHRDAKGYFARFFVGFEPNTAAGLPATNLQNNSYTRGGDALNPQPYSGYPRLEPYDPPALAGGAK